MAVASRKLNTDYNMVADYLWERAAFLADAERGLKKAMEDLGSYSEDWFLEIRANIYHFAVLERALREEAVLARKMGRTRQLSTARKAN